MPTLIAKLKDSGVSTIIEVLDARYGMRPGMLAATSAEYFPEWLIGSGGPTGGGAFPGDLPILVRTADKQQMAHAFGLIYLPPYVANAVGDQPLHVVLGNDQGQQLVGRPGDGRRDVLADPPRGARSHRREDEARAHCRRSPPEDSSATPSSRRRPDTTRTATRSSTPRSAGGAPTPRASIPRRAPKVKGCTCTSTAPSATRPAASRRTRGFLRQVAHHDGVRLHRQTRE